MRISKYSFYPYSEYVLKQMCNVYDYLQDVELFNQAENFFFL